MRDQEREGREKGEYTCVCERRRERKREEGMGGETGVNVCVCEREREVRFTHAPTIMPSWRVEYIHTVLYIIQDKNEYTHRVYKHLKFHISFCIAKMSLGHV